MLFSSAVASTLLFAGAALAQKATGTSTNTTSTSTGTGGPAPTGDDVSVMVVKVSNKDGGLVMEPDSMNVPVGSMIQFQFYPKNHSVVRSTFDQPCVPIEQSQPGSKVGFFSGFMPVTDTMGVFTIRVADKNPIWFYCSQAKHCQSGMAGVINPPAGNSSRTIDTYKALAAKVQSSVSPGNYSGGSNTPSSPNNPLPNAPSASPSGTPPPNSAANTMRLGGAIAMVAFGMALLA
ncbi:MAG: hypothetical protein M1839_007322 [Geoglossum umbratile]|nr:MAG: hypothetical protein M1839_007322 [Geoglossum umbratile]